MNTETRNEIASWLIDRVAQGANEEVGSMDWKSFNDGQEEHRVSIMRDEDDQFPVWMSECNSCADFTLTPSSTEEEVRKIIDEWYDEY